MAPTIGFDFDKCLAEAYTFVPFVLLLEILLPKALKLPGTSKQAILYIEKSKEVFYKKVALNEVKTKGTMFRPSTLKLLPKLIKLRQQGQINKLFIYSNNGINELINAVDHILGLVLQEVPYNVKADELINENDRLHVLTPRIHMNNSCRASEPVEGEFREKSIGGIQACLGESILESELWYLDDTQYHKKLMDEIKDHYIVVEPYSINVSNKKLAELFIQSFPLDAFTPGSPTSSILINEINRIMPGFRPSSKETQVSLFEKFTKVLNKFSPEGSGRMLSNWKEDHVNSDLLKIEKSLHGAIEKPKTVFQTYSSPIGGVRHRKDLPVFSRSNKTRKLRHLRKNRQ